MKKLINRAFGTLGDTKRLFRIKTPRTYWFCETQVSRSQRLIRLLSLPDDMLLKCQLVLVTESGFEYLAPPTIKIVRTGDGLRVCWLTQTIAIQKVGFPGYKSFKLIDDKRYCLSVSISSPIFCVYPTNVLHLSYTLDVSLPGM